MAEERVQRIGVTETDDPWYTVLRHKIAELEATASWASQVGLVTVRDHIRMAIAGIKDEIDRRAMQIEVKERLTWQRQSTWSSIVHAQSA